MLLYITVCTSGRLDNKQSTKWDFSRFLNNKLLGGEGVKVVKVKGCDRRDCLALNERYCVKLKYCSGHC